MDSITRENCKKVLNEVYEGEIEGFIERGDQFFSNLPNSNNEIEFSEHSPLNENKKAYQGNELRFFSSRKNRTSASRQAVIATLGVFIKNGRN